MVDDEKTRWAIDVMTAWSHEGSATDFIHDRIENYLSEPDGQAGLITGLVNLAGLLLSGLELTTGKSSDEVLQAIASTVARCGRPPDGDC